MEFCVFCNDMLRITKNKHLDPTTHKTLKLNQFVNLLLQMYDNEENHYYSNEHMYTLDFSEKDILTVNIDKIKESYPHKSDLSIRANMKKLYKEITNESSDISPFNLTCDTCHKNFRLLPDTLLDSLSLDKKKVIIDESPEIRFEDPTLFRTKNYICINETCPTRTDKSKAMQKKKEAVFYKPETNNHSIRYICGVCHSFWRT